MTDPAQVPWWVPIITAIVGVTGTLGTRWLGARERASSDAAHVEEARTEARVDLEREDTARMQIRAEFDKGAFERAFENKSIEHRECREEVRGLREEVAHLRSEIAECRKDHELRDAFEEWTRKNVVTKPNAEEPPAPRVRAPTPPNGTDIVTLAPIPVARKDPRREP